MTTLPVLCRACAHRTGPATCAAYPAEIPADVLVFGGDHRTPRGDERGGVVFALADGSEAAEAFDAWRQFSAA